MGKKTTYGPCSETQRSFLQHKAFFTIYGGGAGSGKALSHGEKVLTPDGFKNIENMMVGDDVVTPDNTVEKVLAVYPQGKVPLYRVTFQDGRTVDCCGNHLWKFHISGSMKEQVGNTEKLFQSVSRALENTGTKRLPILPLPSPLSVGRAEELPIGPYTLGAILGDGYIKEGGTPYLTGMDDEIFENVSLEGYSFGKKQIKADNKAYSRSIIGVYDKLLNLGLASKRSQEKFIPQVYKNSSIEDRFSILQGLFDTDGYVSKNGNVYFDTTSKYLAQDIKEILHSLGFTAKLSCKRGSYRNPDGEVVKCSVVYKLYVRGSLQSKLFKISRKCCRTKEKNVGIRIEKIEKIPDGMATCISISGKDKLFITTNYIVTHNSHLAQMYSLGYIDDPQFRAVYIRETMSQHRQAGGLWDTAQDMYGNFGAKFRHDNMTVIFPSGAVIQHKVLGADRDLKNFDGGQYSLVVFDEAQWHTKNQIMYLMSRVRSKARGPHRVLCTCNPHPDSPLLAFTRWYLDPDTGIPIDEKSGITRYFAEYRGDLVFGDTESELKRKYGDDVNPQTYTFIAANIFSNPVLMARDEGYVKRLQNLKRSERDRLLFGSWFARETSSKYFKREWTTFVDVPEQNAVKRVRSWDLAGSIKSEANQDPDYTCGVLVARDRNGIYTVEDAYRFRKLSGDVISEIVKTAIADGIDEVQVTIPQETGSGKSWTQHLVRCLAEEGIPCRTCQISGHRGKVQRFLPFTSLAESGSVRILRGEWNDWYLNELESFDGGRRGHDDGVDATADAVTTLARQSTLPTFTLPDFSKPSILPT